MKMRKGMLLVLFLIGAGAVGWATQQAWRVFIVQKSEMRDPVVKQADGKVGAGGFMVAVKSNDPNFTQAQADEQWAKMKQAIANGNYKLRETKETNGILVYVYDITLPDGKVVGFGSSKPIEESLAKDPGNAADK